jgi:hypothetical protein
MVRSVPTLQDFQVGGFRPSLGGWICEIISDNELEEIEQALDALLNAIREGSGAAEKEARG